MDLFGDGSPQKKHTNEFSWDQPAGVHEETSRQGPLLLHLSENTLCTPTRNNHVAQTLCNHHANTYAHCLSESRYISIEHGIDHFPIVSTQSLVYGAYDQGEHQKSPPLPKARVLLLISLYFMQGIPLGLALGSIPYLLKDSVSYAALGVFSLTSLPYSIKLLYSPVVDALHSPLLGRRKSWIVPVQLLLGLMMILVGRDLDESLRQAAKSIYPVTTLFFALFFLAATQDIAVDGWALELLPPEFLDQAANCQTFGLNLGYFISFTGLLSFNSLNFSNNVIRPLLVALFHVRYEDKDYLVPILSVSTYMVASGWAFIVFSIWLVFFYKESAKQSIPSIRTVYRCLGQILQISEIRSLLLILVLNKIGFTAADLVASLVLIDKGFKKEDISMCLILEFVLQLAASLILAKKLNKYNSASIWLNMQLLKLFVCALSMLVIYSYPGGKPSRGSQFLVVSYIVLNSLCTTVMLIAQGSFFARISDPLIGGTYLTLLNTVANIGELWPKYFVLRLTDYFTVANCLVPDDYRYLGQSKHTIALRCVSESSKAVCARFASPCTVQVHGFYMVGMICSLLGLIVYFRFTRMQTLKLSAMPASVWTVKVTPASTTAARFEDKGSP